MKNHKRYYETVDVLVTAYLKGELKYMDSCSCAIGNMVQAKGFSPYIMCWGIPLHNINFMENTKKSLGKEQLDSLPYDWKEIKKIEDSFEFTKEDLNLCTSFEEMNTLVGLQAVEQTIYEMEVWDEDLSVHEASERINKGIYEMAIN